MRTQKLVLALVALALSMAGQKATSAVKKTAPTGPVAAVDPAERQKLHESAMKFLESADARQRMQQTLDKLLEDGKQAMMSKNPGLDPAFGEEWIKRMRQRVSVDQFVVATAEVYEKYFTRDELNELTQGQLALKKGQLYTLPQKLAEELKTNSPLIQRDINTSTSLVGARLGAEVGKEIEREHPEWIKPVGLGAPAQ
jgi:hypothetical protein